MRPVDRWFVVLGTPLVATALAWGTASARTDVEPPLRGGAPRAPGADATGRPIEPGSDAAPAPSNLPDGVSADPLTGLRVEPEPGTEVLTWGMLKAYEYQEGLGNLPDPIRALEGKRVTMIGLLLPVWEMEDIHDFLLVGSHWSCCYGVPPTLSGVVRVRLEKGHSGLPNTYEPLRVVGTFRSKEEKESGYVLHVFQLDDAQARIVGY